MIRRFNLCDFRKLYRSFIHTCGLPAQRAATLAYLLNLAHIDSLRERHDLAMAECSRERFFVQLSQPVKPHPDALALYLGLAQLLETLSWDCLTEHEKTAAQYAERLLDGIEKAYEEGENIDFEDTLRRLAAPHARTCAH